MIATLDHVGYVASDVSALRATFTRLGFAPTDPRPGREATCHALLKAGCLELSAASTARAGARVLCFGVDDLEAARASCLAADLRVGEPERTTRQIDYGTRRGEARFASFTLDARDSPDGLVRFVRNETPELVYQDEVTQHPNGALGLDEVCIATADLAATTQRYVRILGADPDRSQGESVFRLLRGTLRICERARFAEAHGTALGVVPETFGLVALRVRDLAVAGRVLQTNRVPYRAAEGAAYVAAGNAGGTALVLRRGR
jgi:catechol 2,3-dioxygenase-like lactoylglutathione lyase family enzyme